MHLYHKEDAKPYEDMQKKPNSNMGEVVEIIDLILDSPTWVIFQKSRIANFTEGPLHKYLNSVGRDDVEKVSTLFDPP